MQKSILLIFSLCICQFLSAQSLEKEELLNVLDLAVKNYPALKAKNHETEAARKSIDLIKNTALPSLDVSYQANLGTANNLTGLFNPQGILPISGPPTATNNFSPVFGSAASLLLNWQPITFGQREAQIKIANAELESKIADTENEIFKHKINVISTYLDVLLSRELLEIYKKNIARNKENLLQTTVLVTNGLRSSVDTALFHSELSKAKIELLYGQKLLQNQQISLMGLLARDSFVAINDTSYFQHLPQNLLQNEGFLTNPLLKLSQSQIQIAQSKEERIKKTLLPKLNFWATTFGRGSGISANNEVNAFDGFLINRINYGAGFVLTVPLLKSSEVKLQIQQQNANQQANQERLKLTELQLNKQYQIADNNLQNATQIAQELPSQVASATYSYKALQTRYATGLVTFTDLVQAQYSLAKAETDLKKSHWEVWKNLLYKAAISGNLDLFLNQIK